MVVSHCASIKGQLYVSIKTRLYHQPYRLPSISIHLNVLYSLPHKKTLTNECFSVCFR
nr:MAG TPA: hypothetical protein [Caudoviricetes sp.]